MTTNLNTTVHLFAGHVRNTLDLAGVEPIWTGTLSDFWQANQEEYPTWGDMRELRDTLAIYHTAHVGGGAQAKHTIMTAAFLAATGLLPRRVQMIRDAMLRESAHNQRVSARFYGLAMEMVEGRLDDAWVCELQLKAAERALAARTLLFNAIDIR